MDTWMLGWSQRDRIGFVTVRSNVELHSSTFHACSAESILVAGLMWIFINPIRSWSLRPKPVFPPYIVNVTSPREHLTPLITSTASPRSSWVTNVAIPPGSRARARWTYKAFRRRFGRLGFVIFYLEWATTPFCGFCSWYRVRWPLA